LTETFCVALVCKLQRPYFFEVFPKTKEVILLPVFLLLFAFEENMAMWYVYILKCSDGGYYIGCIRDVEQRLIRHQRGEVRITCLRLPVEVILTIGFTNKYKAFDFEKYVKSGSGRAFMNKRFI